jgi:hypothetical protein
MPKSSLRDHLDALATSFADGVLAAIRTASIEDLQAEASGRRASAGSSVGDGRSPRALGRLPRRSQEEIEATLAKVVAAVKKNKKAGMRAEDLRKALSLDVRGVPRVLKEGLKQRKLKAKGRKRATTYFAR